MHYNDIQSAMAALYQVNENFNALMEENGGELTPEAEDLESVKNALADLLTGEGIDSLGRWLKSKEDEKAMYKAEKAAADRRIKSVDKTIDFIKTEIGHVLRLTGQEKVKGTFYSFSQFTSQKTSFDADALDEKALPHIEAIIYSMTPEERAKPSIINPKRKRRIAAGSGQTVEDVHKLLRQFEAMQKMMKKVKRNPKGFMRGLGGMRGLR